MRRKIKSGKNKRNDKKKGKKRKQKRLTGMCAPVTVLNCRQSNDIGNTCFGDD